MTQGDTMTLLEDLKRLEAASTPAPWAYFDNGFDGGIVEAATIRDTPDRYFKKEAGPFVFGGEPSEGRVDEDDPNVQFTIAIRNAAPKLLAVVEAAQELETFLTHDIGMDKLELTNLRYQLAALTEETPRE